jgi:hypothetical protein
MKGELLRPTVTPAIGGRINRDPPTRGTHIKEGMHMAEQTEGSQKNRNKKSDWTDTAVEVASELLKLACSGFVLGVTGAFGHRIVSGSNVGTPRLLSATGVDTVVPLRKTGTG